MPQTGRADQVRERRGRRHSDERAHPTDVVPGPDPGAQRAALTSTTGNAALFLVFHRVIAADHGADAMFGEGFQQHHVGDAAI